jgi:hypothetical protein
MFRFGPARFGFGPLVLRLGASEGGFSTLPFSICAPFRGIDRRQGLEVLGVFRGGACALLFGSGVGFLGTLPFGFGALPFAFGAPVLVLGALVFFLHSLL